MSEDISPTICELIAPIEVHTASKSLLSLPVAFTHPIDAPVSYTAKIVQCIQGFLICEHFSYPQEISGRAHHDLFAREVTKFAQIDVFIPFWYIRYICAHIANLIYPSLLYLNFLSTSDRDAQKVSEALKIST